MPFRPIAVLVCWLAAASAAAAPRAKTSTPPPVRNVILMLSDGTAPEAWALTRLVAGTRLAVDDLLTGAVRTYGADSIITDSAPGATAYATGFKASDKSIAVGAFHVTVEEARPRTAPQAYAPVATLLEGARLGGRSVGLVSTSQVQHATPAAFSAHVLHRDAYQDIAEQQVHQGIDVVLGGGSSWLLPKGVRTGERTDSEDLRQVLEETRYEYVESAAALAKVKGPRVWGAFADEDLAYELDRKRLAPAQPSLAEMTTRAIELLGGRKKGFFLFVEGSKVDWGAHANEPVAVISELKAFDDAVRAAVEFARKDGNTLVVVVADHGTGGISIGTRADGNYSTTDDDTVTRPLRAARLTASGLYRALRETRTEQAVRKAFAEEWSVDALPSTAASALVAALEEGHRLNDQRRKLGEQERQFVSVAATLKSAEARIGWTTSGHTGTDVFLFAFGPDRPTGLWDNAELGRWLARRMDIDLAAVSRRLFVEAKPAFAAVGLETSLEGKDSPNPVLVVRKGTTPVARLPVFRNVLEMDGRSHRLEGVVVLVRSTNPTPEMTIDPVFVPRQAVDLVSRARVKAAAGATRRRSRSFDVER